MDRKFYNDNIEHLLKEKSDEFRMYPSKRVWHSIYNDLHPGRKWPSIAVGMLLIIALLLIGYLNTNDNLNNKGLTDDLTSPHGIGKTQNLSSLTPGSDQQPVSSINDNMMLSDVNSRPATKIDNGNEESYNNNSPANKIKVNKSCR